MGREAIVALGSERSATVKKQASINGLLPTLRVGPFHLFRLHLDLRSDVLKEGSCHFSARKSAEALFGLVNRHKKTEEPPRMLTLICDEKRSIQPRRSS